MKSTINVYDFMDAFQKMGRGKNFSYEGLEALFHYIEEYEEDCGVEMELDVIGLCCDFTEYETLEAFQHDYGTDYETLDDIRNVTQVIEVPGLGFIIGAF